MKAAAAWNVKEGLGRSLAGAQHTICSAAADDISRYVVGDAEGQTLSVTNQDASARSPGLSTNLKRAASYYKNIPRDLPAKCQLPDSIPVGTHGNFIRRPAAWK